MFLAHSSFVFFCTMKNESIGFEQEYSIKKNITKSITTWWTCCYWCHKNLVWDECHGIKKLSRWSKTHGKNSVNQISLCVCVFICVISFWILLQQLELDGRCVDAHIIDMCFDQSWWEITMLFYDFSTHSIQLVPRECQQIVSFFSVTRNEKEIVYDGGNDCLTFSQSLNLILCVRPPYNDPNKNDCEIFLVYSVRLLFLLCRIFLVVVYISYHFIS